MKCLLPKEYKFMGGKWAVNLCERFKYSTNTCSNMLQAQDETKEEWKKKSTQTDWRTLKYQKIHHHLKLKIEFRSIFKKYQRLPVKNDGNSERILLRTTTENDLKRERETNFKWSFEMRKLIPVQWVSIQCQEKQPQWAFGHFQVDLKRSSQHCTPVSLLIRPKWGCWQSTHHLRIFQKL